MWHAQSHCAYIEGSMTPTGTKEHLGHLPFWEDETIILGVFLYLATTFHCSSTDNRVNATNEYKAQWVLVHTIPASLRPGDVAHNPRLPPFQLCSWVSTALRGQTIKLSE